MNAATNGTANVLRMSVAQLSAALTAGARHQGDADRMAAIYLLTRHERWLHRHDFRRHIEIDSDGHAWIDLAAIGALIDDSAMTRAASSETAIVRLACSLTGNVPEGVEPLIARRWSLEAILRPLDRTNAALAAEAVRRAALGPASGTLHGTDSGTAGIGGRA